MEAAHPSQIRIDKRFDILQETKKKIPVVEKETHLPNDLQRQHQIWVSWLHKSGSIVAWPFAAFQVSMICRPLSFRWSAAQE